MSVLLPRASSIPACLPAFGGLITNAQRQHCQLSLDFLFPSYHTSPLLRYHPFDSSVFSPSKSFPADQVDRQPPSRLPDRDSDRTNVPRAERTHFFLLPRLSARSQSPPAERLRHCDLAACTTSQASPDSRKRQDPTKQRWQSGRVVIRYPCPRPSLRLQKAPLPYQFHPSVSLVTFLLPNSP